MLPKYIKAKTRSEQGSVIVVLLVVVVMIAGAFLLMSKFNGEQEIQTGTKITEDTLREFPKYDGAVVMFSEVDTENNQIVASWVGDQDSEAIYKWYRTALQNDGWLLTEEYESSQDIKWITATKDGLTAELTIEQEHAQEEGESITGQVNINLVIS